MQVCIFVINNNKFYKQYTNHSILVFNKNVYRWLDFKVIHAFYFFLNVKVTVVLYERIYIIFTGYSLKFAKC